MIEQTVLFPLAEYWSFYALFTLFILSMLALDLGVFHRKAHVVSFKESAIWSVVWISLALVFNYILYRYALYDFYSEAKTGVAFAAGSAEAQARQVGLEFLTGFIIEKTLAVDNIFIFVVIFTFLGIPQILQHRILFYGVLGALIFRAIFIALGSVLLQYHGVMLFFGALLIITGVKLLIAPEKPVDLSNHWGYRLIKKLFPVTTNMHGEKFFAVENGKRVATPLFVALILIEFTDIIFALDSVPAIFAITKEPLIVYTSNVFAILGLRSLYFMLAGSVDKFHMLKYGLGVVLGFVGLKMVWLNDYFGGKFPVSWSLGFITVVIATSIVASFVFPKRHIDPKN